jgi:heme/copper-type cytochrome/quinol oxidase subunit 2
VDHMLRFVGSDRFPLMPARRSWERVRRLSSLALIWGGMSVMVHVVGASAEEEEEKIFLISSTSSVSVLLVLLQAVIVVVEVVVEDEAEPEPEAEEEPARW